MISKARIASELNGTTVAARKLARNNPQRL
jgi:hypothetical protein